MFLTSFQLFAFFRLNRRCGRLLVGERRDKHRDHQMGIKCDGEHVGEGSWGREEKNLRDLVSLWKGSLRKCREEDWRLEKVALEVGCCNMPEWG